MDDSSRRLWSSASLDYLGVGYSRCIRFSRCARSTRLSRCISQSICAMDSVAICYWIMM